MSESHGAASRHSDACAIWDEYGTRGCDCGFVTSRPPGAFRIDVREATEAAARSEAMLNDTWIALVSGPLMRDTHAWSEPVSVRMVPSATKTGMVEIEVRRVDA